MNFNIRKDLLAERPLSWSAISSFSYDPLQWYNRYILKGPNLDTPELLFGKRFADACELRKPLAPITMLSKMEQGYDVLVDDIRIVGFADTFDDMTMRETGEYKTGVKPWSKNRVDGHGQITMYALMNYLQNKVKPEECKLWLEWIPTKKVFRSNGDYSGFDYDITFDGNPRAVHFDTDRTMIDILKFAQDIKKTVDQMELYVRNMRA